MAVNPSNLAPLTRSYSAVSGMDAPPIDDGYRLVPKPTVDALGRAINSTLVKGSDGQYYWQQPDYNFTVNGVTYNAGKFYVPATEKIPVTNPSALKAALTADYSLPPLDPWSLGLSIPGISNMSFIGERVGKTNAAKNAGYSEVYIQPDQLFPGGGHGWSATNLPELAKYWLSNGAMDAQGNALTPDAIISAVKGHGGTIYLPTDAAKAAPKPTFRSGLDSSDTEKSQASGSGFFSDVAGFLGDTGIAGVASLASLAIPALAPVAAGLNIAQGAVTGNLGQIAAGVLSVPSVGEAVGSSIASGINDATGLDGSALKAATKATGAAAITAIGGGSLADLAVNALAAGAGSLTNSGVTSLTDSKILGGVASAAVSAGIRTALSDDLKPVDLSAVSTQEVTPKSSAQQPSQSTSQHPFGGVGSLAFNYAPVNVSRTMFNTKDLSDFGVTPTTQLRF